MLLNKGVSTSIDPYYDHDFLVTLDSYLHLFRTEYQITPKAVNPHQCGKFEGDFYGLLDDINISKNFHFFVTRFNGLDSSSDFRGYIDYVLVPDLSKLSMIKNLHSSRY